ncbi:ferrochelatase [Salmonella enterica subsp. enterica]|nr:ferrochelatase [Salmonella enterica subsp. enterica]
MLGEKGTGHIQVMCPGFAADCLETLEEIAEQNREIFLEAGGKKYAYIPALNATPEHIDMMLKLTAPYR